MSDSYDKIIAHPGESIEQHISEVLSRKEKLVSESVVENKVANIIISLHDFGKHTSWYQDYIRNPDDYNDSKKLKRHSFIGAVATMFALHENDYDYHEMVVGFYSVAKHHGEPGNIQDNSTYTDTTNNRQKMERLKKQTSDILSSDSRKSAANDLLREAGVSSSDPMIELAKFIKKEEYVDYLSEYRINESTYRDILKYWSTLTLCDRTATAGLKFNHQSDGSIQSSTVERYIQELDTGETKIERELNRLRNEARMECLDNADKMAENDVGLITLPTGFGKTLTGLQTAISRAEENDGRVIYALPFTTIIEQTDDIVQDVFDTGKLSSSYTVHHHLSDTRSISENTDDFTDEELLAKSWQSDIVLTTFVQLFESLAGPTSSAGVKIPSLEDAVVVIDEPQGLSHSWWLLVGKLIEMTSDEYNTEFIMMTATQPKIADNNDHITEYTNLLDSEKYFQFLDENPRVQYKIHNSVQKKVDGIDDPLSLDKTTEEIDSRDGNKLVICNSINQVNEISRKINGKEYSSLNKILSEFYDMVKLKTDFESKKEIIKKGKQMNEKIIDMATWYLVNCSRQESHILASLSTRLRPIDRKCLLNAVKRLLDSDLIDDLDVTLVSTQLVEAGVDISFETVYRDMAPISSLVQSAGRCNRSYEGDIGEINMWYLEGTDDSDPPSDVIYQRGYRLLDPMLSTLKSMDSDTVSEYSMVRKGVDNFYTSMHSDINPGDYSLIEMVEDAEFKSLRRESLIPNFRETVDIAVITDKWSQYLKEEYRDALRRHNYQKCKILSRLLQSYIVSIPKEELQSSGVDIVPLSDNTEHTFVLDVTQYQSQYTIEDSEGICEPKSVEDRFI